MKLNIGDTVTAKTMAGDLTYIVTITSLTTNGIEGDYIAEHADGSRRIGRDGLFTRSAYQFSPYISPHISPRYTDREINIALDHYLTLGLQVGGPDFRPRSKNYDALVQLMNQRALL